MKTENQKDFTTGGTTNKILRIWTFAQDNAYLFAYVSDEDNYDSHLPIAEKIIASIEFIPISIRSNDNSEEDERDSSDSDKKDNNSDSKDNDDDSKDNDDDDDFEDKDGDGDIDCKDTGNNVEVGSDDPHDLDRDGDGIGCDK